MSRSGPIKFICILANARTGTNYIARLLRACPSVTVLGEIFLQRRLGRQLLLERKAHPGATLDKFAEEYPNTKLFKVFHSHLKYDRLKEQIFSRPDCGFILLHRRPIDSYISLTKVQTEGVKFRKADTTDIKPQLDADDFTDWATRMKEWHDWLEREVPGKLNYARLSYENDLLASSAEGALARVLDAIESLGIARPAVEAEPVELPKQDRELDHRHRVANWDAFAAALRAYPACTELLDWAESARA